MKESRCWGKKVLGGESKSNKYFVQTSGILLFGPQRAQPLANHLNSVPAVTWHLCSDALINLQVWRRGAVPPLVDLLCDDGAAQGAALLPVKPQGDAFGAEDVLRRSKGRLEGDFNGEEGDGRLLNTNSHHLLIRFQCSQWIYSLGLRCFEPKFKACHF